MRHLLSPKSFPASIGRICSVAVALTLTTAVNAAMLAPGQAVIGAMENIPGGTGFEGTGDFNDMIFAMSGNITISAPGGVFNNLLPYLVTEGGPIYWDRPSLDGSHMNVGYCLLATQSCNAPGAPFSNYQYLAASSGGQLFNIAFQSSGPITLSLLAEIAASASRQTLGWYDPNQPGILHQLFSGADTVGATVTFNPSGTFALYSTNGNGQFYSSISAQNVNEVGTQQHFAFFQPAPGVPEPGTLGLGGLGLIAVGLARRYRGKRTPR